MDQRFTAQALLEEYWDLNVPVDPEYFADRLGLKVIRSPGLGLKSGYLDADKREIHVNQAEVPERQRFTIAHELGHYCLGHGSSYRDTTDPRWFDHCDPLKEQQANQFAADLLMPALALRALIDVKKIKDPVRLRQLLGVSSQALSVRLNALGYFG